MPGPAWTPTRAEVAQLLGGPEALEMAAEWLGRGWYVAGVPDRAQLLGDHRAICIARDVALGRVRIFVQIRDTERGTVYEFGGGPVLPWEIRGGALQIALQGWRNWLRTELERVERVVGTS